MQDRRDFIKLMSLGTALVLLPSCGGKTKGGSSLNQANNSALRSSSQEQLFVPPLVNTINTTTDIKVQQTEFSFITGLFAPTYSFNVSDSNLGLLGPTLLMQRGQTSSLNFINELNEATTAHQHGLHVDGPNDGGPQSKIEAGQSRTNVLEIDQPAGMHWYHPHPHGRTGSQVIKGLAGIIIIEDPEEITRLPNLPRDYGVNDIPLVIQDKTFNVDGSISYNSPSSYGKRGYQGDNILVNGQSEPKVATPSGWIRLRILNGSNARFYERDDALNFSNGQSFSVIASDGGLLRQPISTTHLPIGPGERYEIMVKLEPNKTLQLRAGSRNLILIEASNHNYDNSQTSLPAQLASIPTIGNIEALKRREFKLGGDMTINGKQMNMRVIDERVNLGEQEVWYVHGKGAKHTFHVHGCSFQVITRNGATPEPWELGWKDTVIVSGKRPVELLVTFNKKADDSAPYMYHCHMLEHEDMGMMGQFTVT